MSRITVKDLARLCGVSIGTIDRAINDRGGINPETKKKILDAAAEYGFVKNQSAISLSLGKPNLIGVIMTNLKNEFVTTMMTAIESEASKRGYSTLIMLSNYSPERERECAERMRAMNLAGLIVFPVISEPDYYLNIMKTGVPVVTVANRVEGIPFIGIDDYEAMRQGTEFVLSRGYERLVYIAPMLEKLGRENLSAQVLRKNGFLDAVKSVEYTLIEDRPTYRELLDKLAAGAFRQGKRTALICPSDAYTIDCLPLIGKDIGIMGFDRLPTLGRLIPDLAGIAYPTADIGKAAVGALFGEKYGLFPFELVPGETI